MPLSPAGYLAFVLALIAVALWRPSLVSVEGWWAQTLRESDLWSGPDANAQSFGTLSRGTYVFVAEPQPFPGRGRLYVQEAVEKAYGYVDAVVLAPTGAPPAPEQTSANSGTSSLWPATGTFFEPFWVANHLPASLWASPTPGGDAAGELPQFSRLLVLSPPAATRLYVQDARTERLGYVDADVVGPSGPPDPSELGPLPSAPPPLLEARYQPWWVAAHRPSELWSGPEGGTSFGPVARGDHFLVMAPQDGQRLHVLNPKTKNYAFIDALAVGPSTAPKSAAVEVQNWQGQVTGDVVNLRSEPHTFLAPPGQVRADDQVTVMAWVEGEELDKDNRTWGRITAVRRQNAAGDLVDLPWGEPAGERFVYSGLLRPLTISQPPEPPRTSLGAGGARWIDVNLSQQVVTAYEGTKAVYFASTTSGRPGWETPTGIFRIQRRVEKETMLGSTLLRLDTMEIPDYHLENVKWTQYFTSGGAALHTNYWRPAQLFGMPSSHGCLGLLQEHALWFWNWTSTGTPLVVHY